MKPFIQSESELSNVYKSINYIIHSDHDYLHLESDAEVI